MSWYGGMRSIHTSIGRDWTGRVPDNAVPPSRPLKRCLYMLLLSIKNKKQGCDFIIHSSVQELRLRAVHGILVLSVCAAVVEGFMLSASCLLKSLERTQPSTSSCVKALASPTSEPLLRNGMTAMLTREDPSQPDTNVNWDTTDGAVSSSEVSLRQALVVRQTTLSNTHTLGVTRRVTVLCTHQLGTGPGSGQ